MLFPPGSLPDGPRLQTSKALILLDFQNDFVSPAGALYARNTTAFLSKLPDLVMRFREQGSIVWTRTEFREPRPTLSLETGGFVVLLEQFLDRLDHASLHDYPTPTADEGLCETAQQPEPPVEPDVEAFLAHHLPGQSQRCCLPGTIGASLAAVLDAAVDKRKDIVVVKSDYSALADMSLVLQLRTRMVTHLYVCGSLSNICVYATVLDAVRHGFGVTIVEDCLGYRDDTRHVSAMRQMADNMGAEGIDYQELTDDLAGLLGDVIKEENFTARFQVDLSRSTGSSRRTTNPQQVEKWLSEVQRSSPKPTESERSTPANQPTQLQPPAANDSLYPRPTRNRSSTLESSPPRKRSTNELDNDPEEYQPVKLPPPSAYRRQSHDAYARPESRGKKNKIRVRRSTREPPESSRRDRPDPQQSLSTGDIPDPLSSQPSSPTFERTRQRSMATPPPPNSAHPNKRLSKKTSQMMLGPEDVIGDGSSKVIYDIISDGVAQNAFDKLKSNVRWQKMYHRTGEVPRLVAVQGTITTATQASTATKTYPIYRHPSDESPELLPFDQTVDALRLECEKHVGHPLNHVLIQHYRTSEDNISEHSDKTLDIVRGSSIVNLSLGAQRTMILRTKKIDSPTAAASENAGSLVLGSQRATQRIPLPNASLFILSQSSNAKYLHGIRADKRFAGEKSDPERAFNCERISLTFRHIGTFVTEFTINANEQSRSRAQQTVSDVPHDQQQSRPSWQQKIDPVQFTSLQQTTNEMVQSRQVIWGQGARNKSLETAGTILQPSSLDPSKPISRPALETSNNASNTHNQQQQSNPETGLTTQADSKSEADIQAEEMIVGFGRENHQSSNFDWDATYGRGFDVVNFVTKLQPQTPVPV